MTSNPRIFIFTGSPVRPQPEGIPSYWHRTYYTVGVLERINVTLPPARGRLIPHISVFPQSSRQTNDLGFTRLGELTGITRLTRTFLTEKAMKDEGFLSRSGANSATG
jgi:hypothetical protein